ncbi:hypothetical protein NIES4103_28390 [Nostoc sp. NIES-4103]|nr:hypothetical protein NIES4103_28390 [Nostoc sp. NIES-4103]
MAYISPKTLTFEDFIAQYRDNLRYELADGELIDMEPTGPHETVSGKLATQIGMGATLRRVRWQSWGSWGGWGGWGRGIN